MGAGRSGSAAQCVRGFKGLASKFRSREGFYFIGHGRFVPRVKKGDPKLTCHSYCSIDIIVHILQYIII